MTILILAQNVYRQLWCLKDMRRELIGGVTLDFYQHQNMHPPRLGKHCDFAFSIDFLQNWQDHKIYKNWATAKHVQHGDPKCNLLDPKNRRSNCDPDFIRRYWNFILSFLQPVRAERWRFLRYGWQLFVYRNTTENNDQRNKSPCNAEGATYMKIW